MYLHLGSNVLINKDKIIAIIDLDTTKTGQINRDFFNNLKKDKNVNYICQEGKEKTLILTLDELFFSTISSTTLYKRSFNDKENDFY